MADDKVDEKADTADPKTDDKKTPAHRRVRPAPAEVNVPDEKPEDKTEVTTKDESEDEPDRRLDNRTGDQKVPDEAWATPPQQVDGGEITDKRKLDTNSG